MTDQKRRRRRPTDRLEMPDLATIVQAAWDDFRDFMFSDEIARRHPEGEDWEFAKKLRGIMAEHEEVCKSIFGSGFVSSQELMKHIVEEAAEAFARQHMARHHRDDPKAPRA